MSASECSLETLVDSEFCYRYTKSVVYVPCPCLLKCVSEQIQDGSCGLPG